MPPVRSSTLVETASGGLPAEAALTVIAALVGGPVAPLLPVLAKSLAATRQRQRIEATLLDICNELEKHEQALVVMTDAQYKLVNESVLALLQTAQVEKLKLLKNAVSNALITDGVADHEAVLLSRVIRDISPEEAAFLARNYSRAGVTYTSTPSPLAIPEDVLSVAANSADALLVTGLLSLGILTPAENTWEGIGVMRFSRLAPMLLALLRPIEA
jgi:hypothetical protein